MSSSCYVSQCSDFDFLWGSAKVNVWTSIDFHSGNQVTRNVILGELVQVSIRQGFSRELQRLERFARAACAKDRRYQEVWSARGLATWKGTRFLDGTLIDFLAPGDSKIARLQLHWITGVPGAPTQLPLPMMLFCLSCFQVLPVIVPAGGEECLIKLRNQNLRHITVLKTKLSSPEKMVRYIMAMFVSCNVMQWLCFSQTLAPMFSHSHGSRNLGCASMRQ